MAAMAQLPLSQALSSPLQATQVTTAASNSSKPCNQWPVALQAFTRALEVTSLGQRATQHLCQWNSMDQNMGKSMEISIKELLELTF